MSLMASMKGAARRHLPLFMQHQLIARFGSLRAKEQLGLVHTAWHAYGLVSAAEQAQLYDKKRVTVIEFGVANGRGLRNIIELSEQITRETGIGFDIFGFDSGAGLPEVVDYRDHPEKWSPGDCPMQDPEKLKRNIAGRAELIIGDVAETGVAFHKRLSPDSPIGFCSIDVDFYSSCKAVFKVFDAPTECFLPITSLYFDDCFGRSEFNRFCGELLAIDEFNSEHEMRKIDNDRGFRQKHKHVRYQAWFEGLYNLHMFDHPLRFAEKKRGQLVLPEFVTARRN